MRHRLKKEYKDAIRRNNTLAAAVADAADIQTNSLPPAMHRNTLALITLPVLDVIKKHTGVSDVHDLIEAVGTEVAS